MTMDRISDAEIIELFGALDVYPLAVLAVSGGSDSMALMTLAARWRRLGFGSRTKIIVATVDHGLRPGSAEDACWVCEQARALGFPHTTLAWLGDKPATGIQDAAREARYRLLEDHARGQGGAPAAIVTAHTEDDQAETLLMRLARGSGVDGLAAMRPVRPLSADGRVVLLRPLLGFAKRRLTAELVAAGISWRDDPSNDRLDFERVRVRAAWPALAALGLSSGKLALSARRLARAGDALDRAAGDLFACTVDVHGGIFAGIDRAKLTAAPGEIALRVVQRVLQAFGGEARPARLAQVESLWVSLAGGEASTVTLGGCVVMARPADIHVFREPGRAALPEISLVPGAQAVWDRRFHVSLSGRRDTLVEGGLDHVIVRALGPAAYATLRDDMAANLRIPARAAAQLPSFWSSGQLIAVPQLAGVLQTPSGPAGTTDFTCQASFLGT